MMLSYILCDFLCTYFVLGTNLFPFPSALLKATFSELLRITEHHIVNHGLLFKECPTHLGENIPIPRL